MFYKEIQEHTMPGSAFLDFLEHLVAQILKIYLLGTNHGGTFKGLMHVPVCPKNLWIHH